MNNKKINVFQNENFNTISKAELNELLKKLKNGDKKASDKIILSNMKLVFLTIKRYFSQVNYDIEDLISIGTIGLIKATTTFDISKNYEFSTYASRCIYNEIMMLVRKQSKDIKCESIEEPLSLYYYNDKDIKIIDTLCDETVNISESYEKKEIYYKIYDTLKILNENEIKIIVLSFGLFGYKKLIDKEIGEMLNLQRYSICRIRKRAIEKISHEIKKSLELEDMKKLNLLKEQKLKVL